MIYNEVKLIDGLKHNNLFNYQTCSMLLEGVMPCVYERWENLFIYCGNNSLLRDQLTEGAVLKMNDCITLALVKITPVDAYMHIYCYCVNLRVCIYICS